MTVSELLEASLRAHERAKPRNGRPRDRQAMVEAQKLRADALALDPRREDPSWHVGPGHEQMVAFYAGFNLPAGGV